jgi:hypothetical protein
MKKSFSFSSLHFTHYKGSAGLHIHFSNDDRQANHLHEGTMPCIPSLPHSHHYSARFSRALDLEGRGPGTRARLCTSTPLSAISSFHHRQGNEARGLTQVCMDSCSRAQRRRRCGEATCTRQEVGPMIPQSCIFNPGLRGFHRRNFSAYRKVTMRLGGFEVFSRRQNEALILWRFN